MAESPQMSGSQVLRVGFFDSGVGGLCILRAFQALCPGVETEYIADTAHCPYGNRPSEEIRKLSEANVRKLLKAGCQMIVVACNTATAAAIDYLRAKYPDVPFVGLEPAIKPAAQKSKTGIVGVLATAGTFHGRLYNETKAKFAKNTTVLAVVADEFVEAVEKMYAGMGVEEILLRLGGAAGGDAPRYGDLEPVVRRRIEPLLKAGCDKVVLGCTHFPHLKPLIEKICGDRAEVLDPAPAVARQAKRILMERGWL